MRYDHFCLFDTIRRNVKPRFHLSAFISLFVRVETSALFSLLHIFTGVKYSTPSLINKNLPLKATTLMPGTMKITASLRLETSAA
jgi:hypothetical protein